MKTNILTIFAALAVITITHAPTLAQDTRGVKTTVISYPENGKNVDRPLYQESYALVIGMNKYQHWRKLPGTLTDVEEVRSVLLEHGFKVDVAPDLTGDKLRETIDSFIRKNGKAEKRRILIYFAGHGATLRRNDGSGNDMGFIVPIDAPIPSDSKEAEAEFRRLAVSTDSIQKYATEVDTIHSLFVFDSCFSGFLNRAGNSIPDYISARLEKPARQLISSGSATQEVPDNSVFRKFFVDGLRGAADSFKDGYITGNELAEYLRNKVTEETKGSQTPQSSHLLGSDYRDGEMIFSLKYNAGISEDQAWERAETVKNEAEYKKFQNTFPASRLNPVATERIIAIRIAALAAAGKTPVVVSPATRGAEMAITTLEFETATVDARGIVSVKTKERNDSIEEDLGNNVKLKLVRIPGGKFKMGSESKDGHTNEKPVREVTVTEFYMGIYEVTRKQWEAVRNLPKQKVTLPKLPETMPTDGDLPAADITWEEAVEFCARLNTKTGRLYSLPSEAEWEYATRAKSSTEYAFGTALSLDVANYDISNVLPFKAGSRKRPIAVGSLVANNYGLYDIYGNVAEWCLDDWVKDYENAPLDGSARLGNSAAKVIRGGSYTSSPNYACSSCRIPQQDSSPEVGFRVVNRSVVGRP